MAAVSGLLPLCQFCVLVSFVMAPNSHIKLISENLCHNLTWETGNQTTIPTHYRVQYINIDKVQRWTNLKECFDTIHLSCDLTEELRNPHENYLFRVESFTENGTLLWAENISKLFLPIKSTILGPPTVNVAGCNCCLIITIQPPVCQPKSPDKRTSRSVLHEVYPELIYKVILIKAGIMNEISEILEFDSKEENFTTTIQHLLPRTKYCVSVNATATVNLGHPAKPSPWKCAVTGPLSEPGPDPYIPAAICGVLLTSGILAFLIVLYKGGCICIKWTPMPEFLSDFSTLEHMFNNGKDQLIPELLTSVKVEFKGVKKRVREYSEDDKTDSEDDEGYPEYTHHFGGRVTSRHEHSSANTGISGDSALGERSNQEGTALGADEVNTKVCQLILNEEESVDSVHFAPILEDTCPSKLLENCNSFNVNLNSVLLGDSEEPWKQCGASQAPLLQDLDTSIIAQADGALQNNILHDMTDVKMGAWPVLPETCTLNETSASSDSEESHSDVNQAFGYMKRKFKV